MKSQELFSVLKWGEKVDGKTLEERFKEWLNSLIKSDSIDLNDGFNL